MKAISTRARLVILLLGVGASVGWACKEGRQASASDRGKATGGQGAATSASGEGAATSASGRSTARPVQASLAAAPARKNVAVTMQGINIGEWIDAKGMEHTGAGAPSPATLRCLATMGLNAVRLPIDARLLAKPGAGAYGQVIHDATKQLIDLGMTVLVDLHPPPEYVQRVVELPEVASRHEEAIRRTAEILSDLPVDQLALELLNEPHGEVSDAAWQQNVERMVAAARTKFSGRLLVSGLRNGTIGGLKAMSPIADPQIVYSVHFYEPLIFTHQGAPFGWVGRRLMRSVPFPPDSGGSNWESRAVAQGAAQTQAAAHKALREYSTERWGPDRIRKAMEEVQQLRTRLGGPIWLGEFGVQSSAPPESRERWMREVREAAAEANVPWFVWQLSGTFAIRDSTETVDRRVREALGLKPCT